MPHGSQKQEREGSLSHLLCRSPKGKDEGSEAAGVKGAEEAAVEDPNALPPPPKRLPSAEAKAGGGDDDELPPPPAQKAGDGASPPAAAKKSPADIKVQEPWHA